MKRDAVARGLARGAGAPNSLGLASRGLLCHLEGEPWAHVPALAGWLPSQLLSKPHPPWWPLLHPCLAGFHTQEPPPSVSCCPDHTHPTFLRLPLSPSRLNTGVSRGWNMSSRKTGPIRPPPTWVGQRLLWPSDSIHPLELPPGGYPNPFSSDPGCSPFFVFIWFS